MFNNELELFEEIMGRYPNDGVVVMMYTPKLGFVYIFENDSDDFEEEEDNVKDSFVIYKDNELWNIAESEKAKRASMLHLESIRLISESVDFEDDIFDNGLDLD